MKRFISIVLVAVCTSHLWAISNDTTNVSAGPMKYDTGSFLNFAAGGGFGQLGYYNVQGGEKKLLMPSATAEINYTYFFLPWLGLGTGVNLSYYTSEAHLTDQMTWDGVTDTEGDNYVHRVDFSNWRERQNELMLEIPLALHFKVKPNKAGFYFNIGAKAGIPVYANYIHNRGDLIHSGYYEKWDVVMKDLPGRFETEPLLRAQEGSIYNKVRKINAAGFAELGALFQLDPRTDLTLGVYANYYINNHSAVKAGEATELGFRNSAYHTDFMEPYEGLVGTKNIGAMHPWSAGVKIGIQAHIMNKAERKASKVKKQTEKQDVLPTRTDTAMLHDTLYMTVHDTLYMTVHDTIFVRDTLYMTVHDTIIGNLIKKDTTWIVKIDTICPDPLHPGKYINISEERLRKEEEQIEQEQIKNGYTEPVITEQGKHAAKSLDGKLTTSVIWFHFDDYKPILEPFDVIDTVAQALLANPDLHVYVNGHACKIGKDSYNQRLAMKRAQAVARLLRLKGVPAKQMTVRSLGANEPYRYNGETHQYSKDRRVEIVPMGADDNTATDININTAPNSKRTDINFTQYSKFIGEEKVKEGSRLAQIARRWYGHQEYWVYIYEANADKIQDPSLIHPGLVVMIPDLKEINAGLTENQAVKQAQQKAQKYKN